MAKTKWITVDTSTLKGLKQAERLHVRGWNSKIVGLYRILFWSPKKEKKEVSKK